MDIPGVANNVTNNGANTVDLGAFETQTTPTAGPDILFSTRGDDSIAALGGDDLVLGSAGNHTLNGGLGAGDTLSYETLIATTPNVPTFGVRASLAVDDLIGDAGGNDTLFGGAGSDILVGGAGANVLYAATTIWMRGARRTGLRPTATRTSSTSSGCRATTRS